MISETPHDIKQSPGGRRSLAAFMHDYHLLVPNVLVRMANTMSTSALPLLLVSLGFQTNIVGYIVSFGGVTSMLMNFVGGAVSDYSSKRRMMLVGIIGVGISTSLLGAAKLTYQFIALRILQGFSTGVFRPTSQALAYEVNPSRRAYILGLLGATYVVGSAAGPALAGVVADQLGLRIVMFVAGGCALIGALYTASLYGTLPKVAVAKNSIRVQLATAARRNALQTFVPLLVVMTDAWILNSWHVYLPIYLSRSANVSYTVIGLLIGFESAVYVLAQPYAGKLIDRMGVRLPIIVAMAGHGLLIACLTLSSSIVWITICLTLVGILNSAANPASVLLTAKLSSAEDRGFRLGLLSSASNLGQFVGPIIAGSVIAMTGNIASALLLCIVPGVIGALAPLLLPHDSTSVSN